MNNKMKTLGDYVELQRGTTYKGALLNKNNEGPVLLGLASIARNGGFRSDNLKNYSGESPDKLLLFPGDLFVSLKDVTQEGDLLGSVARVPKEIEAGRLTQDTVGLIIKDQNVKKEYLYWILRTPEYRGYCRLRATGTTNLGLSRSDFLSFPVPVFNLTREYLIKSLESLEEKIVLNRQMNQTLEAMAQALFKSWFVDFDPVMDNALAAGNEIPDELQAMAEKRRFIANRTVIASDAGAKQSGSKRLLDTNPELAAKFPSSFVFNEALGKWIPEGWEVKSFGEEFKITMGQSPPGTSYNEEGIGKPFFQGKTDYGFRFPTNRIYCTDPKREAKKNDTLISVRAPVGNANLANSDCVIGRGLSAVRHKSNSVSFTYYSVLALREVFDVFEGEGTVFGSINQSSLKSIQVIKPSISTMEAFDQFVSEWDKKIESNSDQIENLTQLRDRLLPELISGKVKVQETMPN